jgi:hypothetical protein
MMSLKTVGILTWEACKTCRHGISGKCGPFINPEFIPEFHYNTKAKIVECADYLSIDESEE